VPPIEDQLAADRADAAAQLAALTRDFEQLVLASEASNADDEHDPEGATIGFERAQLSALIDQTRARLADLDRALEQVRSGGYGVCERCGRPIGEERLAARPAARTCIGCAR
jgi:RNA polymerase-binding transcription factor DksA